MDARTQRTFAPVPLCLGLKNILNVSIPVPPELGARGRISIDLARFKTCVYTVENWGAGAG